MLLCFIEHNINSDVIFPSNQFSYTPNPHQPAKTPVLTQITRMELIMLLIWYILIFPCHDIASII